MVESLIKRIRDCKARRDDQMKMTEDEERWSMSWMDNCQKSRVYSLKFLLDTAPSPSVETPSTFVFEHEKAAANRTVINPIDSINRLSGEKFSNAIDFKTGPIDRRHPKLGHIFVLYSVEVSLLEKFWKAKPVTTASD